MTEKESEDKAIVRLEVRIPEAKRALRAFATNRKKALETLMHEVRSSVASAVNQLMNAEISLFLGETDQSGNKRNGYRTRTYALKGLGQLEVHIPRDRNGEFNSVVVPRYERTDPRLRQDMALLHLAGLSNRTLAMMSQRILGLDVKKDTVSSSLELVKAEAERWLTRPLADKYWALYMDGTTFRIQRRGSTEREPMLVVLGVTKENHRSILAIEPGTRENVDCWRAVFSELKRRGLDAKAVRIGIMDGLPGLEGLFADEFTNATVARCWAHAMRNACAKAPARLRVPFKELANKVMYADSEDDAKSAFLALKEAMNNDAQRAVNCLHKDLDALLAHYKFDKRLWIALKTTNAIERVHKEFKRRTKPMETIGESTLTSLLAFTALRLELGWRNYRIDSKALKNLRLPQANTNETDNPIEHISGELNLVN